MSPDHHHVTDPNTGRGSLHPHGSMEPHGAHLQEVPLLEIDHVTSGYENGPVIQDVSIKIRPSPKRQRLSRIGTVDC